MRFYSHYNFNEEIYDYIGSANSQILHALSGISYFDTNYEIKRVNSTCYSIEYIYEGEGTLIEDGIVYHVKAGDFYILHPMKDHHYFTSKTNPWKKIFLTVSTDISLPYMLLKQYNIEDVVVFPHISSPLQLEKIYELIKSSKPDISLELETLIASMIIELAHLHTINLSNNSVMNDAKKMIDKSLYSKIKIEDICDTLKISQSHFRALFSKSFGISPRKYIIQSKIECAKAMLTKTRKPIGKIAEILSFNDAAHFTNTFKKATGISPQEYRENHS